MLCRQFDAAFVSSRVKLFLALSLWFALVGAAQADRPMEELPMYGGQHNPSVEKSAKFSQEAANLGWQYYYNGDYATAIRRFNQAWLFDRDDVDAYWGFGLIMGQRARMENTEANLQQSVRLLQLALDRAPRNGRIMGDLAFSHSLLGQYEKDDAKNPRKAAQELQQAGDLFPKAYAIEAYPPTVANWSLYLFYVGDIRGAKARADEAAKAGYKMDPAYLKELGTHL